MRDSRIDAPRAPRVASTITMPLASGARLGPYEVIAPIGAGGMGEVYRARDTRLNRTVALKILPPELITTPDVRSRFEQEARAASALNHPNIVTIYDVGDSEFGAYIAMELVDGKTLRQVLADGPLPTRKLLQAAGQIGDGLAKAHGAGIVHRDLKPENVMITRDGLVKILDFGLAKLAETSVGSRKTLDETTLARTAPGLLLGTVGYMSPEQASGQTADYRADQFSFGAILYEMTTGKRAFQRGTPVETLSAIIRQEPEPLAVAMPRTPPPLRWIIDRCLAKAPDDRYASTRDLARELQSLLEHLPELEISTSAIGAMPETPVLRRRRGLIAAGVLVAGGALLAAALLLGRATPATRPVFRQLTFRHGNISGARFAADGQT
ncbi:MAG: serine/threonine protein kinase, partial [Acidobacteria bacterium]|nr:serine/threonine protein kinase [Acidobacteriota bacterium]